jgi:hypothetical protein
MTCVIFSKNTKKFKKWIFALFAGIPNCQLFASIVNNVVEQYFLSSPFFLSFLPNLLNQHRSFFCVAAKIQVHEKEIVQYL